jgi:hypothetical protein
MPRRPSAAARRGAAPQPPERLHDGALAAATLAAAAELRAYASVCPWAPESRADLRLASQRLALCRRHLTARAAALLPG